MSGRDNRSARVVIMDDISWSEPTPRSRRGAADLDPPEWMQQSEPRFPSHDERHEQAAFERDQVSEDLPRQRGGSRRRLEIERYEQPVSGYVVDESLDEDLGALVSRWQSELAAPPVDASVNARDDEQIWGPRPRLMAEQPGGRRTVVITGRGADRHVAPRSSARGGVRTHARHGFAADRTAMWAVLLCVILLLVALTSH
jgi:hypothetical protein